MALCDDLPLYHRMPVAVEGFLPFLPCLGYLRHEASPMLPLHPCEVIIKEDWISGEVPQYSPLPHEGVSTPLIQELEEEGFLLCCIRRLWASPYLERGWVFQSFGLEVLSLCTDRLLVL